MKSYIDVSFTLEEDLSHWTDKQKDAIINDIDVVKKVFIDEFYNNFKEYEDSIKDLKVNITFEDRK